MQICDIKQVISMSYVVACYFLLFILLKIYSYELLFCVKRILEIKEMLILPVQQYFVMSDYASVHLFYMNKIEGENGFTITFFDITFLN